MSCQETKQPATAAATSESNAKWGAKSKIQCSCGKDIFSFPSSNKPPVTFFVCLYSYSMYFHHDHQTKRCSRLPSSARYFYTRAPCVVSFTNDVQSVEGGAHVHPMVPSVDYATLANSIRARHNLPSMARVQDFQQGKTDNNTHYYVLENCSC